MLTVSRLARTCGLRRGTVLYYESNGLLTPARRSAENCGHASQHLMRLSRQSR